MYYSAFSLRPLRRLFAAVLLPVLSISIGCSDSSGDGGARRDATGPAADLSEQITGANAPFIGASAPADVQRLGYGEYEYVAAGTAVSYRSAEPLPDDGQWLFEEAASADYRTRILVRRPLDPARFSGTVIVEWLNVSGGVDASVQWVQLEEEVTRAGHAWVGVSAQVIGVEGGPVLVTTSGGEGLAGVGLKTIDPERYASLSHPGDAFSFDIYSQVARALLEGGPAMGHMEPELLISAGESQSAAALVTYYNGVQPLARVFDGFLVHSRGAGILPLVEPGEFADFTSTFLVSAARFRTDVAAPLIDVQAENDIIGLLNSIAVRQPDSDTFRLWEVAGTAHADTRLVGASAAGFNCGLPINDGPEHFVVKADLLHLENWLRTGEAPPTAPRLAVTSSQAPAIARDADGIALGGIRSPLVDVPVDVLSGEPGPNPEVICILSGSTKPLTDERLAQLYVSRADYLDRYTAATDAAIAAGFILEADREALLAMSQPERIQE